MTSGLFGTPKMIVPYEWNFECVEEEPAATIASKLILFRGEKVFRVGLKNHTLKPVLFFMVIDLRKIGMKVKGVRYGIQGSGLGPEKMTQMENENISDIGNLQLFTINLAEKVSGNYTIVFQICIVGTDPGYSFQLSDRLSKDQLGAAPKSQQNLADVEFVVKDKTFPAHRAILAARSPVFADEFEKVQAVNGVPHQIRIDGVEPSTVENFVHFIYTGETMGTLEDEELLQLADHYQLTTLTSLCKVALKKTDSMQMANLRKRLNSNPEELSSSKIM
jgi:speckle-type POZ protein